MDRRPLMRAWCNSHRVEEHQSLDEAAERGRLPMAIIRLADSLVERFVLHVKQPAAVQRARDDGRGVPGLDELGEKVLRLLAVRQTGEGAVLPLEEHAREDEHVHNKLRLPLGESKPHEDAHAGRADAVAQPRRDELHHRKSSATPGSTPRPPRRPVPPTCP
jgi:hypothetical protein